MQARDRNPAPQNDRYPPIALNSVGWLLYAISIVCMIGAGVLLLAAWTASDVVRGQRSPWIGLATGAVLISGLLIWLELSPRP